MATFRANPRLVQFYVAVTDAARKKGLVVKNTDNFNCTILKNNSSDAHDVLLSISVKGEVVEVKQGDGKPLDGDGTFTYEQLPEAGKYLAA